jgi:hypothetical protein
VQGLTPEELGGISKAYVCLHCDMLTQPLLLLLLLLLLITQQMSAGLDP